MRIATMVALSVAVAGIGTAIAQEALTTVEVRAEDETGKSIVFSCSQPAKPSLQEVEQVLSVSDPTQTNGLRVKLMDAAAQACEKREPRIIVMRGGDGGLTWKPAKGAN